MLFRSIASGAAVAVMYDGTNFQLLTESGGQSETVSNLIATGGLYSKGNFGGTYTDGIVVDYTSTLGRISVGTSDGLAFYNGGVATTELMRLNSSGNLLLGTASEPFGRGYANYLGITSTGQAAVEINGASGSLAYLDMGVNGTRSFNIVTNGTTPTVQSIGALPLAFATNGTTGMTLTSGGQLQLTNDASINGLTVGKGGGSLSTNTALGITALQGSNSGTGNNTAVGYQAGYSNTTGTSNSALGRQALAGNSTGNYNTALGDKDRKSTRLNSSHTDISRMPSSA